MEVQIYSDVYNKVIYICKVINIKLEVSTYTSY